MLHAYRSRVTFFDLAQPSVYYRKGQRCADPESTFCATCHFRCASPTMVSNTCYRRSHCYCCYVRHRKNPLKVCRFFGDAHSNSDTDELFTHVRLNPFHTTDSDPTKLFCRVGVGGVNRVGDSFQ